MLNPPWVFGVSAPITYCTLHNAKVMCIASQPVRQGVMTVDTLNLSSQILYNVLVKGDFLGVSPLVGPAPGQAWMDVRDVAEAHVRALEVPAAGGERILIVTETMVWQDWRAWPSFLLSWTRVTYISLSRCCKFPVATSVSTCPRQRYSWHCAAGYYVRHV
jgi:hypothetical protein